VLKVTFTLDDETIQRLRRLASRLDRPRSQVVRESLKQYEPHSDQLSEQARRRMLAVLDEIKKAPPRGRGPRWTAELRDLRAARRRRVRRAARRSCSIPRCWSRR
jgi:predicted transcriptional regulator